MEKIKIIQFNVGQEPATKEVENTLETMQEIVGGYIETVWIERLNDGVITLVCDEEGLLKDKPVNKFVNDNQIVGDFFIAKVNNKGDFISLSEEDISIFSTVFRAERVYLA